MHNLSGPNDNNKKGSSYFCALHVKYLIVAVLYFHYHTSMKMHFKTTCTCTSTLHVKLCNQKNSQSAVKEHWNEN